MEQQSESVKPPSISATRIKEIKEKKKRYIQIQASIKKEEAILCPMLATMLETMTNEHMQVIASASSSSRRRRGRCTSDRPMQDEVEKRQQEIEKLKEKLDKIEKELQSWKEMGFNIEDVEEEDEA